MSEDEIYDAFKAWFDQPMEPAMETYSVWYYSSEALGSIQECECKGVGFETACKWFKHHTTNVTANVGLTKRVIITDSSDYICAEWKYGEGITWPKEDKS